MTYLDKLKISGIRSYNPNQSSTIQFYSPLTLIVGPNGSGKTTLIESLKYACTGDLPPNSKGGAFIYDPKIARDVDVKAQVKLKFRVKKSGLEVPMIITRSLQLTQRKTKVEQKTLETLLSVKKDNDFVCISGKCADIDKEMIYCLGTSKAILDNVIFCHQEESVWILSEPTNVKKKLDDIFAASLYSKALDVLKTFKRETNSNLKLIEQELNFVIQEKERMKKYDKTVKELKNSIITTQNKINLINEKSQSLQQQYENFSTQLKKKKEFTNSKNEIYLEIRTFKDLKPVLKPENLEIPDINSIENEIEDLKTKIEILEENKSKLKNDLEILQKNEEENKNLKIYEKEISDLEMKQKNLITKFESIFDLSKLNLCEPKNIMHKFQEIIKENEENLQILKNDLKRLKIELNRVEDYTKRRKIQEEVNKSTIDNISTVRNKLNFSIDGEKENIIVEELKTDSDTFLTFSIDELKNHLKNIQIKYEASLQIYAKLENELKSGYLKFESSKAKLDKLNIFKHKYSDFMHQDINKIILSIKTELREMERRKGRDEFLNKKFAALKEKVYEKVKQLIGIDFKLNSIEDTKGDNEESNYENTLLNDESLMFLKNNNPNSILKLILTTPLQDTSGLKSLLNQNRVQIASSSGAKLIYKNLKKKGIDKCECILCNRKLNEKEKFEYGRKLDKIIEMIPENARNCEKKILEIENEIEKIEKINQLKRNKKQIISELNFLFHDYDDILTELDTYGYEIKNLIQNEKNLIQNEKKIIRNDKNQNSNLKNDIKNDIKNHDEVNTRNDNENLNIGGIKGFISKLIKNEFSKFEFKNESETIKTALSIFKVLNSRFEMSDFSKEILKKQQLINDLTEYLEIKDTQLIDISQIERSRDDSKLREVKLKKLIELLEKIISEKEKINLQIKKKEQLENENLKLREEIKSIEERNHKIISEKEEIEIKIDKLENSISKKKMEFDIHFSNFSEIISRIKNLNSKIKDINKKRDLNNSFSKVESEYEKIVNELEKMKNKYYDKLDELSIEKERIAKIVAYEKYEDSRTKIKNLQERVKKIEKEEKEYFKIEDDENNSSKNIIDFYSLEIEEIEEKLATFQEKINKILNMKNILIGENRQNVANLEQLKKNNEFQDTELNYRNLFLKNKIFISGNDDLERIIKAFEKSIIQFHNSRIEEVNRILKDLWVNTYKGNDIDYIELKSEFTNRSYNYKLVMFKNGIEMDMRGRCSSGQKLISSILFRLALADAFCQNCSIMALDEPTTNLDKENIESLAETIKHILSIRRKENFQFIIITHDECFTEMIRDECEYFYRVRRDNNCDSVVERYSVL
ncbi:DNA repair protein rad50 [Dictyocoela muelleri]|nr:DNA repair protein rad50 [Dictyocoela muelleri]